MLKILRAVCVIVLVLFLGPLLAGATENWEFVRNEEGIYVDRILRRDSPIVVFRGTTSMQAPVSSLMAVLFDVRTQAEWNNNGYDLRVLQKNSDTELWYYASNKAPWPFRDRDFVAKLETRFDAASRTVVVTGTETTHIAAPPHPKRVRMPVARVNWTFAALAAGRTRVTVTFQIDPGGILPVWLMNKVTKGMPFRALRNIRDVIAEKKYDRDFEKRFTRYNSWHAL